MDLASIYFGLFLGIFIFTFAKVVQQTRSIWRRTHSLHNAYLYLIWGETLGFYLFTVVLWATQTQLLPQIIANRVSLIMTNKDRAKKLKWGLVIIIGCINIAVCYIWTTAHMPGATPSQVQHNLIFEKSEKALFLAIDLALNLYFLYLVRFRLIADGLSKYWRLFNFNAGMVVVSTSMDVLLLGFLSLPDPYLYVQFAPVAYIIKLHIELLMANLISKVVRSSTSSRGDWYSSSRSNPTNYVTSRVHVTSGAMPRPGSNLFSKLGKDAPQRKPSSDGSEIALAPCAEPQGITKTVETMVRVDSRQGAPDSQVDKDIV
ncbi:hypothetical protein NM208_g687 [Fusarium decemcellulare]|uniref:Uncharacterized protein n=1 Tax=Fusarium decemcellulare TaxID=57161 RepID=A0ACC1SYX4_9HYPO|nr:hypothetical protein NM208_g687 [Fusarium decemcellulare]